MCPAVAGIHCVICWSRPLSQAQSWVLFELLESVKNKKNLHGPKKGSQTFGALGKIEASTAWKKCLEILLGGGAWEKYLLDCMRGCKWARLGLVLGNGAVWGA